MKWQKNMKDTAIEDVPWKHRNVESLFREGKRKRAKVLTSSSLFVGWLELKLIVFAAFQSCLHLLNEFFIC